MDAQFEKRACLVYVPETEEQRDGVRQLLEAAGYAVCQVKAEIDDALAASVGQAELRQEIIDCMAPADLCIFLLPEDDNRDGQIGIAAGYADSLGKRLIGIVAGARTTYPDVLEDFAPSMVRVGSERLASAIAGEAVWETVSREVVSDRRITHVRCQ